MKSSLAVFTLFVFIIIGLSFSSSAHADWSIPINVTLNNVPLTPFPLEFGMKSGASDFFDATMDAVAPLSTPDGDDAYFINPAGEATPYDKLLKDYRAVSGALALWKLVLKIAPGKTLILDWSNAALPNGSIFSWQDADDKWNGKGLLHYFSDPPRKIVLKNQGDEVMMQRILIKSN